MIDTSTLIIIIMLAIIGILAYFVWKFLTQKPIGQPITKNQYERIYADFVASAKLNRTAQTKWIGITGDDFRPPIKKYFRYKGDMADPDMLFLCGQTHMWSPKRCLTVPWDLVEGYGHSKQMWIRCNGFIKDGYFLRPIYPKGQIAGAHFNEYYDSLINNAIFKRLAIQGIQDEAEQIMYESLSSSAHKDRPLSELQQKHETPQMQQNDEIVSEPEV